MIGLSSVLYADIPLLAGVAEKVVPGDQAKIIGGGCLIILIEQILYAPLLLEVSNRSEEAVLAEMKLLKKDRSVPYARRTRDGRFLLEIATPDGGHPSTTTRRSERVQNL